MKFDTKLIHGRLIKRYKRFLADVMLDDGSEVTVHCTNSGSMKSCLEKGADVFISPTKNPSRKTRYTWEMIKINNSWVGINTNHPNQLAYDALKDGFIPGLEGYTFIKREVQFEDSRIDIYAEKQNEKCFIEVKNVTLKKGQFALFPDAVTTRGRKHLQTLERIKKKGMRAVMLYIIQRQDVKLFAPAVDIDPEYTKTLKRVYVRGVEIIPLQAFVSPEKIELTGVLQFRL